MFALAWKNLWQERNRFLISVGTIAAVIFLILVLQGILNGSLIGATKYVDHFSGDLVVMQDGVSNMHMASSLVPKYVEAQIRGMSEVEYIESIFYLPGFVRLPNDKKVFAYFSGIETEGGRLGPWEIIEGRNVSRGDEVIIDESILLTYDVRLGEQVKFLDKELTIVGMARDTGPIINPVVFMPKDKLESLANKQGVFSYAFIWLKDGTNSDAFATKLQDRFPDEINVLSGTELVKSDQEMLGRMSADLVKMIVSITLLTGLVVIVLMLYTITLSKIRDYGIIKAVGGSNIVLLYTALWQGVLLSAAGFFVGLVFAWSAFPMIEYFSPGIGAFLTFSDMLRIFIEIIIVGAIAAFLPVWKMQHIDPMLVFK